MKEIEREPRNFAKAVINNLNPPKYVIEALKRFEWMCHFCWKPRMDLCFICQRSICEEHCAKTIIGPKTKLEWYVCQDCFKVHSREWLEKKVAEEDEKIWLEEKEEIFEK